MDTDAPAPEQDSPTRSRWGTLAWIICSAALVVLVLGVWLRMGDEVSSASLANAIIEGERPAAPALPTTGIDGDGAPGLPDWYAASGGEQVASTDGAQVLVVNWWASWCGPCEEEMPELQRVADEYDGRVVVVGVNSQHEDLESDARAFVRRHEVTYPIVRGPSAIKDSWGVGGFPETFVVGTDGRLSAHVNGPVDAADLRDILDVELEEQRT